MNEVDKSVLGMEKSELLGQFSLSRILIALIGLIELPSITFILSPLIEGRAILTKLDINSY